MIHIGFSRMKRPQWWPLTRTSWIRFSPLLIYVSMVKVECFSSFILHSKVPSSFLYLLLFQLKSLENHISEQILSPLSHLAWSGMEPRDSCTNKMKRHKGFREDELQTQWDTVVMHSCRHIVGMCSDSLI